jgi:hypothetical protein
MSSLDSPWFEIKSKLDPIKRGTHTLGFLNEHFQGKLLRGLRYLFIFVTKKSIAHEEL